MCSLGVCKILPIYMGKPEYQLAQDTQKLSYTYMECMDRVWESLSTSLRRIRKNFPIHIWNVWIEYGLFATAYATELAHGGDPAKVM